MSSREHKPYWEKLRDPRWQKKRLEIMERDGFACVECGDDESTLNVHHGVYFKGRDPWDYDDALLKTLCEGCHKSRHDITLEIQLCLNFLENSGLRFVKGFAAQLCALVGTGNRTQVLSSSAELWGAVAMRSGLSDTAQNFTSSSRFPTTTDAVESFFGEWAVKAQEALASNEMDFVAAHT